MTARKLLVLVVAFTGCGSSSKPVVDGTVTKADGAQQDMMKLDGLPTTPLLQTVVNKLIMPNNATEYAYDYGSGPVNKVGGMLALLKATAGSQFDFQKSVDDRVNDGTFLMLMEMRGNSLTDDPVIGMQAWLGKDKVTPTNPADRFNGSFQFTIDPSSPQDLLLGGSIAGSQLSAGPGTLLLVIPVQSGTAPTVTVKNCRIKAAVADNPTAAMTDGKIYGAIPQSDINDKLIPVMAEIIDGIYNDPATSSELKAGIQLFLDPQKTGHVTADAVRNNAIVKNQMQPDVDTDGDGSKDSLSAGFGFTSVKAVIEK